MNDHGAARHLQGSYRHKIEAADSSGIRATLSSLGSSFSRSTTSEQLRLNNELMTQLARRLHNHSQTDQARIIKDCK
jgi:hypothetical protein